MGMREEEYRLRKMKSLMNYMTEPCRGDAVQIDSIGAALEDNDAVIDDYWQDDDTGVITYQALGELIMYDPEDPEERYVGAAEYADLEASR